MFVEYISLRHEKIEKPDKGFNASIFMCKVGYCISCSPKKTNKSLRNAAGFVPS